MATQENEESEQPMEDCAKCGETALVAYLEDDLCPDCREE